MTDRIISEGERWTIWDAYDAGIAASYDSWNTHNPESRARETFESYPRKASLWCERVVKYDKQLIAAKPDPRDINTNETNAATVATNEGTI